MRGLSIVLAAIVLAGCSKVGLSSENSFSVSGLSLSDVSVTTKKNKAITFQAGDAGGKRVGRLSFTKAAGGLSVETTAGKYEIIDPVTYTIRFTPHASYVGQDMVPVYVPDDFNSALAASVNMRVGNTLNTIQPALAVRGISCITCHTQASSNIVTDYGHGSPWYFDSATNDSFYFDRVGNGDGLASLNLMGVGSLTVPKGLIPDSVKASFPGVSSLADWVRARFAQGSPNTAAQVKEINSLKISLPTAARIAALFGNPGTAQAYLPDTQDSPALSGLALSGQAFVITDLTCDGDLFLDRPAIFVNATVRSNVGCRIYSTKSVFIEGAITSVAATSGATDYNVQILSAESIWAGTGRIVKNGAFCELDGAGNPSGWFSSTGGTNGVDCKNVANAANPNCDSFVIRTVNTVIRNTYSNAYPNATSLKNFMWPANYDASPGGTLAGQRASIEAALGRPLYDASCGAGRRNVTLSRLLLAAPYVNNRYSGDVIGSVIAEAAIMSLGSFKYEFDPVFKHTSIFSLLDENELISGEF